MNFDSGDVNNYVMEESRKMYGWSLKKLKARLKELEDSEQEHESQAEQLRAYGAALMDSIRNSVAYKESEIRLRKRNVPEWVDAMDKLKDLSCDNENKRYVVFYKEVGQTKPRVFQFHRVKKIAFADSFEFIQLQSSIMGILSEEPREKMILMDIEIENLEISDPPILGIAMQF